MFKRQTDAVYMRFEAYSQNGALKLPCDPRYALPASEITQQLQIGSTPGDSLTTRTWHGTLPLKQKNNIYMLGERGFQDPRTDCQRRS
jgi:hypothetical protein